MMAVTTRFSRDFACRKCEGIIGKAVMQKGKLSRNGKSKGIHIFW